MKRPLFGALPSLRPVSILGERSGELVLSWAPGEDGVTSPRGSVWGPGKDRGAAGEAPSWSSLFAAWEERYRVSKGDTSSLNTGKHLSRCEFSPKQDIFLSYSRNTVQFSDTVSSLWVTLDSSPTLLLRKAGCLLVLGPGVCVVLEAKNERCPNLCLFF